MLVATVVAGNGCAPLPAASTPGFDQILYQFLEKRCYSSWPHDAVIRNTGPFLDNKSFGTHPAVKVYYSPEVWSWVQGGRKGALPAGATIVKEMYPAPAQEGSTLSGWTTMVKDPTASRDGWYWSYHGPGEVPNKPIDYPDSGFGQYCLRCHASAESESTFSSIRNTGPAPLSFMVQVPTMPPAPPPPDFHSKVANTTEAAPRQALASPHADFTSFYDLSRLLGGKPLPFPVETYDHVRQNPNGTEMFITSDQCLGCHSASSVNMAVTFTNPAVRPINLSPYTEWRASMMGLAGRDPVFHAQLAWEKSKQPKHTGFFDQTCYRCHGVMGQRQIALDTGEPFEHSMVYTTPGQPNAKYGALAREGVSCAACHHVAAKGLGTPATFTGQFATGQASELYGPYERVVTVPMEHAVGATPTFGAHVQSSALCGSCHTVVLPVFDRQGKKVKEIYEQTTYLEWRNSVYQNERQPVSADAQTCQACHMPTTYKKRDLTFRIANVEDASYPEADHRAPDDQITPTPRKPYSRHMLMGINLFTLAMFQQFSDLLGIRSSDYMYSEGVPGLQTSHDSALDLAQNETATISVTGVSPGRDALDVNVQVVNLAGHSFPTGVEFRRVFIELLVLDAAGKPLWASGRTTPLGVILKGTTGEPLKTEMINDPVTGKPVIQPHHQVITREDQVQIYEELVTDPEGHVTTSFVALNEPLKENRLQPRGWRRDGPDAELTRPIGGAAKDPQYRDGSGSDSLIYRIPFAAIPGAKSITATLYYQSIPPYYLRQRFAASGPEVERLAHIASRLNVEGSSIADWKLRVASARWSLSE